MALKKKPSKKMSRVKTPKRFGIGITPLADRVVVRPSGDDVSTLPSGIIIPDTVDKERPSQGTVVAVGLGAIKDGERIPVSVKEGDRVVFSKYGYDEVEIRGEDYYIIKEENILAVIN